MSSIDGNLVVTPLDAVNTRGRENSVDDFDRVDSWADWNGAETAGRFRVALAHCLHSDRCVDRYELDRRDAILVSIKI